MAIRSGRFRSPDATGGSLIIKGRTGAFYRIINSGENKFTVDDGDGSTDLDQRMSVDVAVTNRIMIRTSEAVAIEGIYEFLDTDRPIRSGRFKKKMKATDRHKIIDLNGGGASDRPAAFYRLFNSGKWSFEVRPGVAGQAKEVAPEQSFDFEIPSGVNNRDIYVNPLVDPDDPSADHVIEGIYDFLG